MRPEPSEQGAALCCLDYGWNAYTDLVRSYDGALYSEVWQRAVGDATLTGI